MGTNVLGQFLRSICDNSDWKYAVFWQRKYHQNQTILIWEDGYCDNLKPRQLLENISGNDYVYHTQKHFSPGCGIGIHTSNGCPIELALSDMACVHYVMGEGVVGEVAYRGTYSWKSFEDDILAIEHSLRTPELPSEWLPQIEAGIKTLLLVAVAPFGVLQLGSLEVVIEDMDLPARIRREFSAIQNRFTMFSSSNSSSVSQSTSSFESVLQENSDVSAMVTETFPNGINCEDMTGVIAELPIPWTPRTGNVMPQFAIEDLYFESGEALLDTLIEFYKDGTDIPFSSPSDIKEEEWETYTRHSNSFLGICHDPFSENMNSDVFEDFFQNFYEADNTGADHLDVCNIFGIPSAYELCDAFISDLQPQTIGDSCETSPPNNDVFNSDNRWLVHGASEWYSQKNDVNDLFDAVVPNRNDSTRLMSEESTEPFSTFPPLGQLLFDKGAICEDESDYLWSHVTSVDTPRSRGSSSKNSSSTAIKTLDRKLINDQLQNEVYGDKKSSGRSKPILRKTMDKPINKQKRRPRDRQLIQDRLKVLRDLVPNGEKFSIDGLLERTIKHMMFLRKVSDQSQKLRAYQEVDGEIKLKSSQRKDNIKSGASWAYQVGREQHDAFPIVVEDLDIPGHMLIEMLCNDHDLFLEVAQVICGLDLTIVKGGMKTRSSSSWAQFVVEVHKGFQRMDVFWPLMQLLQRNPKLVLR
ncbi:unnamed protein product [Rhodiola kirilowii]